jgi:hypothetical protein
MRAKVEPPILLLNRDGYEIHVQVNVGWSLLCVWTLIHKDPLGLRIVAEGWRHNYDKAQRDAFDAYLTHSNWTAAIQRQHMH